MKLYHKDELKNSRLFFDKKPPAFLTVFIIFVTLILISTLITSAYVPKNYIIEAQGTITSKDNTYVGALSDGVIISLEKKEGEYVKTGEVLFSVSDGNQGIQLQALNDQLNQAKQKIEVINLFNHSLDTNTNKLSKTGLQQEYYSKMEYYLSVLNDENTSNQNNQNDLEKKKLKKQEIEKEILDLKTKILSLEQNEENEENQIQIDELKIDLETKESELETITSEIDQGGLMTSNQSSQTKLQLAWEASAAKTTLETNVVELQGQINAYQNQDSLYQVKANQDGYIHYLSPLKEGMTIQKTQTIAKISENKNQELYIEAYIPAKDISKVKINDPVKVALDGENKQQYGTIQGKLEKIDIGTITKDSNQGNVILYRCTVSIDQTKLTDSKNNQIDAIKSMPVVARIVYDKETYLNWILDMLNFTN